MDRAMEFAAIVQNAAEIAEEISEKFSDHLRIDPEFVREEDIDFARSMLQRLKEMRRFL